MTKDDNISRAAAIDAIQNVYINFQIVSRNNLATAEMKKVIQKIIDEVIKAQTDALMKLRANDNTQKPKKGHWIDCDVSDDYSADGYDCSVCGVNSEYATSYCPNCGADMQEAEGGNK